MIMVILSAAAIAIALLIGVFLWLGGLSAAALVVGMLVGAFVWRSLTSEHFGEDGMLGAFIAVVIGCFVAIFGLTIGLWLLIAGTTALCWLIGLVLGGWVQHMAANTHFR